MSNYIEEDGYRIVSRTEKQKSNDAKLPYYRKKGKFHGVPFKRSALLKAQQTRHLNNHSDVTLPSLKFKGKESADQD